MAEFSIQFESEKLESETTVLHLKKGNYKGMRSELAGMDWERSLAKKTVDQQWQTFMKIVHH